MPDNTSILAYSRMLTRACRHAAAAAYEDALIRGLCSQGAMEASLGTIESLDFASLLAQWNNTMNKPTQTPAIRIKRVAEPSSHDDGVRVLVDRLWPRGVSKEQARIDGWFKDIAPSDALRTWFGHEPARWESFRHKYQTELRRHEARLGELIALAGDGPLTLVYAAHDQAHNNAVVLRDYLLAHHGRVASAVSGQAGLLLSGWRCNAAKVQELMVGITPDNMTCQPGGLPNHPAWTLAHLIHYHPAILRLVQGRPVDDPSLEPNADIYDEGSTPVEDASIYPTRNELLNFYLQGHRQIEKALRRAPESLFSRPPGLTRWARAFPTTGEALVYLMLVHESQHIGQIMAWRRAMSQDGDQSHRLAEAGDGQLLAFCVSSH